MLDTTGTRIMHYILPTDSLLCVCLVEGNFKVYEVFQCLYLCILFSLINSIILF